MKLILQTARFLAARPLTVILMALSALSMAVITLFEATDPAREVPYRLYLSPFFTGLLWLVWINLACNAARRTWWRTSRFPSILTHVGFLLILTGGYFTWTLGIRGNLMISEGDRSGSFFADTPVLRVASDDGEGNTTEAALPLLEGGAFRSEGFLGALNPFAGRSRLVAGAGEEVAIVDTLASSRIQREVVATAEGPPAVRLDLGTATPEGPISLQDGDRASFPEGAPLTRVTYRAVAEGEDPEELARAEFGEWIEIRPPGAEPVLLPLDVRSDLGEEIASGGYTVRVTEYHPDFKVGRTPSPDDPPLNPAVRLHVAGPCGEKEMYAFARVAFHGNTFPDGTEVNYLRPAEGASLLVLSRGDRIVARRSGDGEATLLEPGRAVTVGTGSSAVEITLDTFLAASRFRSRVLPDRSGEGPPAFRVRVGDGGEPEWATPEGGRALSADGETVAWVSHAMPLGFELTLNDAVAEFWPASSIAKAYYSLVSLADPDERAPRSERIETNAPLLHRGFRLYQSGMDQEAPYRHSTFAVARDPGLPVVTAGFLIMTAGLLWLFTVRFIVRPARSRRRAGEATS